MKHSISNTYAVDRDTITEAPDGASLPLVVTHTQSFPFHLSTGHLQSPGFHMVTGLQQVTHLFTPLLVHVFRGKVARDSHRFPKIWAHTFTPFTPIPFYLAIHYSSARTHTLHVLSHSALAPVEGRSSASIPHHHALRSCDSTLSTNCGHGSRPHKSSLQTLKSSSSQLSRPIRPQQEGMAQPKLGAVRLPRPPRHRPRGDLKTSNDSIRASVRPPDNVASASTPYTFSAGVSPRMVADVAERAHRRR